jgi:perosamine synthetase
MIPLSSLELDQRAHEYVNDALRRNWISGVGDYIPRFEAALSQKIGRRHTIAVSNGTDALELALKGLGVGAGDEVIVPALTFAAPAAAVCNVGAKPVFVDVHLRSWTIDPLQVVVTERTKALIAVDTLGHPADYWMLREVVGDVPIIQDAAEAHGALFCGQTVGAQGDISIFSFHANKAVPLGEGGAVLTDDDELAEKMRELANHGMKAGQPYFHEVVGSNYRLPNLQAAIGLAQVERWDELIAARADVALYYDALLPVMMGRRPACVWATPSTWLYCIALNNRFERDLLLGKLQAAGIDARALWRPLPEMPPYADGREYPMARAISDGGLLLPTWAGMTLDDVRQVVGVIAAERVA